MTDGTAQALQGVVTVVAPIRPGRLGAVDDILQRIAAQGPPASPVAQAGLVPFDALTTVHFLRWVVLPEARDARGQPIGPELVMASCFDGTPEEHLAELARVARDALAALYGHCEGGPEGTAATPEAIVAYLRAHVVPAAAYYVASPGRSVRRIQDEARLRNALEEKLDEHLAATPGIDADTLAERLREHVRNHPTLGWAFDEPARPPAAWRMRHWGRLAAVVAAGLALLPVLLPVGLVVLGILRRAEQNELPGTREPIYPNSDDAITRLSALAQLESFTVENEVTHVSPLRPGRFVTLSLRVIAWVLQLRATYVDTHGSFGGIASIHFAHWNVIDGGRRLLFCSNYDGTWESYLDEFIDRAASALTAVWSRCIDFPPTRWLMIGGARDEERFKAWFRRYQVPTAVWYSAYPRLSVQNIQINTAIREALRQPPRRDAAVDWLRHF
jgi:hypothetical protein